MLDIWPTVPSVHFKTYPTGLSRLGLCHVAALLLRVFEEMLLFCPSCSCILIASDGAVGWKFMCNVCPFKYDIRSLRSKRTYPKMKVRVTSLLQNSSTHRVNIRPHCWVKLLWQSKCLDFPANLICGSTVITFKLHHIAAGVICILVFQELDDVLGGSAAWANVDSTAERCPKCSHSRAYFMQIQTRSADEPMTTFYKCCNQVCGHRWRD